MQAKKVIKVSFAGETKRFKMTSSYQDLLQQTRQTFGHSLLDKQRIQFYYLDDEQELISVSSQQDFQEALELEDGNSLKLTVAANAADARAQLQQAMIESASLAESLNSSQMFAANPVMGQRSRLDSQFSSTMPPMEDPFGATLPSATSATSEFLRCETERSEQKPSTQRQGVEEIGPVFSALKNMMKNLASEFKNAMKPTTAEHLSKPVPVTTEPSVKQVCDEADHVLCFKCKGTKVKPNGKPCGKCKQTGRFCLKSLGGQQIREQVQREVAQMDIEAIKRRIRGKSPLVHPKVLCDVCNSKVKGIRYKCSVCPDYDLCAACEAQDHHPGHVMLKIRKPAHAPVQFHCVYKSNIGGINMFPNMYVDKIVSAEEYKRNNGHVAADMMPQTNFQMPTEDPKPTQKVEEPKPVQKMEEPLDLPKMVPQNESVVEVPEVVAPTTATTVEEPKPAAKVPETDMEIYMKKVEVLSCDQMRKGMKQMFDFGLESFDLNKRMLTKYCLNVDAAVNAVFEDDELYN